MDKDSLLGEHQLGVWREGGRGKGRGEKAGVGECKRDLGAGWWRVVGMGDEAVVVPTRGGCILSGEA